MTKNLNTDIIEDIYNWLHTAGVDSDVRKFPLVKSLVLEELKELEEAVASNNKKEQMDAIVDLVWVSLNAVNFLGITLSEIKEQFEKVSYSNWTKFCTSSEEATQTSLLYSRGQHPSKPGEKIPCYVEEYNNYWIVRRTSDGKIMKSINFQEP